MTNIRETIIIEDHSKCPSLDEWTKMGEPHVLILTDKCGDYELYEDIAYGYLVLVQNGKVIDRSQLGFVRSPDLQTIGLDKAYFHDLKTSTLYTRSS